MRCGRSLGSIAKVRFRCAGGTTILAPSRKPRFRAHVAPPSASTPPTEPGARGPETPTQSLTPSGSAVQSWRSCPGSRPTRGAGRRRQVPLATARVGSATGADWGRRCCEDDSCVCRIRHLTLGVRRGFDVRYSAQPPFMKTILAILIIPALSCVSYSAWRSSESRNQKQTQTCGTCRGTFPCTACKNCSACKYCHVLGGHCGVCNPRPQ